MLSSQLSTKVECWFAPSLIPMINLFSIPSILNWLSINTLVDTWLTLHEHLAQQSVKQSVDIPLIFIWFIWLGRNSADYRQTVDQSSVDKGSTKYRSGCWLRWWVSIQGIKYWVELGNNSGMQEEISMGTLQATTTNAQSHWTSQ